MQLGLINFSIKNFHFYLKTMQYLKQRRDFWGNQFLVYLVHPKKYMVHFAQYSLLTGSNGEGSNLHSFPLLPVREHPVLKYNMRVNTLNTSVQS